MKTILFAVAVLAVPYLLAKPASSGEGGKAVGAKWNGDMAVYGKAAEEANYMRTKAADLSSSIEKVVQSSALKHPDREASVALLSGLLGKGNPLVIDPEAPVPRGNHSGADVDRGMAAVTSLKKILVRIDGNSRSSFDGVMALIRAKELVKLVHRMDAAVYRIELAKPVKQFQAFDKAYGEFMKYTQMMAVNKASDIVRDEVMMVSKLDKFLRDDLTVKPSLDRTARIVDGLLAVLNDDDVKKLSSAIADLEAYLGKAKTAVYADSSYMTKQSAELAPRDRTLVTGLCSNFVMLVDEVQKLIDDAKAVLAKIEDGSSEVGKLRNLKEEISPNEAFFVRSGPNSNHNQDYCLRILEAASDCRRTFHKESLRIHGRK